MKEERIFVIGDIHGCLGMLKRLMERIAGIRKGTV